MIPTSITPRNTLFALFSVLLVLYALFQARFLILGPRIHVATPADNQTLTDPVLTISGTVQNTTFLSLNDRQIFTDKEGHWQEKLIASPGLTIMKLEAKDRFGRKTEKLLRVVLNQ